MRNTPLLGRSQHIMPEPPTFIHDLAPQRGPRFVRAEGSYPPPAPPEPPKPRLKKLRLFLVLSGLTILALISTVFGMLMAVASDLPSLDNRAELRAAENSLLFADGPGCKKLDEAIHNPSCRLAKLTGNLNRILVDEGDVSPYLKNAVIAIEDRRFYEHEGVDYTGIARALWQDLRRRQAVQGGSTITQQFVKNALSAQGDRSVFQKLRESALAYHLERKWPKDKILTQYLNTVYFGNGAYGVESAMRTYFGDGDDELRTVSDGTAVPGAPAPVDEIAADEDRRYSFDVEPAQAALLAGMIASPSLYDPVQNPRKAKERRDLVLSRMLDDGMITRAQYDEGIQTPLPREDQVDPPSVESAQPYFTTWMTEHLVRQYRPSVVFGGGLKVQTTIDPELQSAAEQAIAGRLAGIGPSASLVAIDNDTGEVKAMVGGTDFGTRPFNLATNGHRQPGSAFKPFILVRALADGVDPNSTWASQPKQFRFMGEKGPEIFKVSNYEDSYLGVASLWSATAASDNSVFAELGMQVKPRRVARLAQRMGIKTQLSTNPAMLLGGLEEGVTALEMAYAYSTLANNGKRVSGTLAPDGKGPVAIREVTGPDGTRKNEPITKQVISPDVAQTAKDMLRLVVTSGTGKAAQVGDEEIWGKTGTTENYGDAWFAGGNDELTVAIWVGYADRVQAMEYEHAGPVAGGTFPAEIFHDFMSQWVVMREVRRAARRAGNADEGGDTSTYVPPTTVDPNAVPDAEQGAATPTTPSAPDRGGGGQPEASPQPTPPPEEPAPAPSTPVDPALPPATPPSGGSGGGGVAPGQP
jgi:penicillin-binding protein 1A